MNRLFTFSALTVAVACVLSAPALAKTPQWLKQAAAQTLPSYPKDTKAVQLLDEQIVTVGSSGRVTTRYRRAYKILRPEGRGYGTMSVYFDNETELTYLKAWAIPPRG